MAFLAPASGRGELTVVQEQVDGDQLSIYRITVDPAPEPSPALRHRLLLRESDYKPGNAALHYLRAFAESGLSGTWKRLEEQFGEEELHDWYGDEIPLNELPIDKVRQAARVFDSLVDNFVAPASERQDCNWGHHVDELRGAEIFMLLLPEIQETRSLSRMLALRTRAAIADGQYDRALDQLRMNYQLGVNTAKAPFLVSILVGIAEASIANQGVIELIAAPDSPNLYWAIAELPRPLISARDALRLELSMMPQIFPFLMDADTTFHSPEEWARLLADALADAGMLTSGFATERTPLELRQAAVTGLSLVIYPDAKRRLLAAGMDPERVEQMPVGQVVAVDALQEYRRVGDEMEKSMYVPYYAMQRDDPFKAHGASAIARGYGYIMASLLLPATQAVRTAEMRLERHRNAIQTVEAIRMHAAQTGKLPEKLSDVRVVVVPKNPMTGESFAYRLEGDTAVLDLPSSDGAPGVSWRFEVKLAP